MLIKSFEISTLTGAPIVSVFEFATMPVAFGASFFGKKDIANYPLVGWISKKFGVVFVDRRPSHARDALAAVSKQMHTASYPVVIFPEGTTTNGAYVKEFKSSLFNIAEEIPDLTIQPMVITYRTRRNKCVNDRVLANDYAYFANAKQDTGPKCEIERSAFGQVFHIAQLGGMTVHIMALEPVSVAGMDRKEIAKKLHQLDFEMLKEIDRICRKYDIQYSFADRLSDTMDDINQVDFALCLVII